MLEGSEETGEAGAVTAEGRGSPRQGSEIRKRVGRLPSEGCYLVLALILQYLVPWCMLYLSHPVHV